MSRVDWQRVRPLIERLLELPEDEHEAYLLAACDGDAELMRTAQRLYLEECSDGDFLDLPFDAGALAAKRLGAGDTIGAYTLVRELGRGGMGTVWLAERSGAFEQQVALKLVKLGMDTEEVVRRFRRERQLLADLEHPGIVKLYDGGATDDGRPYLVLELVDGRPIDTHCDAHGLDVDARLELFARVCEAVAVAHEFGVVHRDLKPSNVLVTDGGEPKVLDFGIAKVLADEGPEQSLLTRTGERLLTPRYAAPEQVRGEACTAATDVYALGVLLYELLCNRPPYDVETASVREIETAVCDEAPPKPSAIVDPRSKTRLAGDLDVITLRALAKEPERRYRNASALGEDVRHHLANRPIRARADTTVYRLRKFVRRHRTLVTTTSALFSVLLVALVFALVLWRRSVDAEEESRRTAYSARLQAAEAAIRNGQTDSARSLLESAPLELRGWEWRHLRGRLDRSHVSRASTPNASDNNCYESMAVSPKGDRFVQQSGRHLTLHRLPGGERLKQTELVHRGLSGQSNHTMRMARFDPSGQSLAIACTDGAVRILDSETLATEAVVPLGAGFVNAATFDPRGRFLACSIATGEIVVLSWPDLAELARWEAHEPGQTTLAFDPRGERLASASWDQRARIWGIPGFELEAEFLGHEQWTTGVAFALDSNSLITASLDGTARVWDLDAPASRPAIFRDHIGPVHSLAIASDGTVFSGDESGTILRWRPESGETIAALRGHSAQVQAIAPSPRGDWLVSGSLKEALVWSQETNDVLERHGCEYQSTLAMRADGREVAIPAPDGRVHRWTLPAVEQLEPLAGPEEALGWILEHRDDRIVASGVGDAYAWTFAASSAPLFERTARVFGGALRCFAIASTDPRGDRRTVAILHYGLQRLSSTGELGEVLPLPEEDGGYEPPQVERRVGAFRTDDLVLLSRSGLVWSLGPDDAWSVAFDSGLVAQALFTSGATTLVAHENSVSLWQANELDWRATDIGASVLSAAFHPHENRIALGTSKGAILFADRESGEVLCQLNGHAAATRDLAFTPDGRWLVSCSQDGSVRFWSADETP